MNPHKRRTIFLGNLVLVVIAILVILVINSTLKTEILGNDKEVAKVDLTQNIGYVESLTINIKPDSLGSKGATYQYILDNVHSKDGSENTAVSLYLDKNLPDNNTATCHLIVNEVSKSCKVESYATNYYPEKEGGSRSPLRIVTTPENEPFILTWEYYCSECSPGSFHLEYTDIVTFWFFNLDISHHIIQDIREEKTKTSATYWNSTTLHLEGDKPSLEKDKNNINNGIFFRVYAKNFYNEIISSVLISILAGIITFWIIQIVNYLNSRSNNKYIRNNQ